MPYIVREFSETYELKDYYDCVGPDCDFNVALIDGNVL
jgi:hypothetical protein